MAKSRLEPRKIERYAESNVPRQGISGIPAPRIQRSTPSITAGDTGNSSLSSTGDTGTSVNTGGSSTPPPPPPPPAPTPETRAFSFDGATELTGSFPAAGGSSFPKGLVYASITPGWSQEETGSFTLYSVSNPTDVDDYRRYISFRRTSGSNGYEDFIVVELSSGSYYDRSIWDNPFSPNFYSGSTGEVFFQVFFTEGWMGGFKFDGTWYGYDYLNPPTRERFYVNNNIKNVVAKKSDLTNGNYVITIGGQSSGSDGYFKGSIGNFALTKHSGNFYPDSLPLSAENDTQPHLIYRFEGNVSASKGGSHLGVVGTEAYVSGSL